MHFFKAKKHTKTINIEAYGTKRMADGLFAIIYLSSIFFIAKKTFLHRKKSEKYELVKKITDAEMCSGPISLQVSPPCRGRWFKCDQHP